MIDTLSNFEKLFRVKQWVKNLFIFFPLLFAGKFYLLPKLSACFIAFVGFCLVSSSVYILNDLIDIRRRRNDNFKLYLMHCYAGRGISGKAGLT